MISLSARTVRLALLCATGAHGLPAATLGFADREIGIAAPGESISVVIGELPPSASPNLALRARDWLGNHAEVRLIPATSQPDAKTIHASFAPPWIGWMELVLTVDGKPVSDSGARQRLAVIPKVKSEGRYFRYGVSDHTMTLGGAKRRQALILLDTLGVDIAREDVSWNRIQKGVDAPWDFSTPDSILADYEARGIEMLGILNYGVPWATTGNPKNPREARHAMPKMDLWLGYVGATIEHYKSRIRHWEIWNEPDIGGLWLGTTAQHVELFNRTSAEIARLQPDALILNGGFAMVTRPPNPRFVEEFIPAASPDHWHIRSWHDYNTLGELLARWKHHEELYKSLTPPRVASMPDWITEGGFHTVDASNEGEQARALVKKISTSVALGSSAYFVYSTQDTSRDRKRDPIAGFYGLADYWSAPKPGFAAYNRIIAETAHRRYLAPAQPLDVNQSLWSHVFAAPAPDDTHVVVFWKEGVGLRTPVWLDWPAARALDAIDIMGNPVPIARLGDGIVTDLGNDPIYVRFRGEAAYPRIESLLELPSILSLVPGKDSELSLTVRNPTDRALVYRLSLAADQPSLKLGDTSFEISLGAGARRSVSVPVGIPAAAAELAQGRLTLSLATDSTEAITATLPYEVARLLAPGVPAAFSLTRRSDIRNLHEALANADMDWTGPDDLSATSEWRTSAETLSLSVKVTDQTHHQPNERDALWRADSLQFAFRGDDRQSGHLELLVALDDEGRTRGWVVAKPGWARLKPGDLERQAAFSARRTGTTTTYTLEIPWKALGYERRPADAWRASFIVNDDDGRGRKQWVQLSPGIGDSKRPQQYPLFLCEP